MGGEPKSCDAKSLVHTLAIVLGYAGFVAFFCVAILAAARIWQVLQARSRSRGCFLSLLLACVCCGRSCAPPADGRPSGKSFRFEGAVLLMIGSSMRGVLLVLQNPCTVVEADP